MRDHAPLEIHMEGELRMADSQQRHLAGTVAIGSGKRIQGWDYPSIGEQVHAYSTPTITPGV